MIYYSKDFNLLLIRRKDFLIRNYKNFYKRRCYVPDLIKPSTDNQALGQYIEVGPKVVKSIIHD